LYLIEERSGDLVHLDTSGVVLNRVHISNFESEVNQGFEGITFRPPVGKLYLVHEANPLAIVELDTTGSVLNRFTLFFAPDLSGITFDDSRNEFIILSDVAGEAYHTTLSAEYLVSWETGIDKAEGIAVNEDTLYIVSDSESELYTFIRESGS
jgi:uncharacterized protein YjiK